MSASEQLLERPGRQGQLQSLGEDEPDQEGEYDADRNRHPKRAAPEAARGSIPSDLIASGATRALPTVELPSVPSGNVAALEARLRALGYVD